MLTFDQVPKQRGARCGFEWTRREFQGWAEAVAGRFGYAERFLPVGPEHPEYGPPTQMGVFGVE